MDITISPRQRDFINAGADEVLFGGAAGGGKSYGQLVDALLYALKYPGSVQLALRRTYPDLERSLVLRSLEIYPREIARYNSSQHRWQFVNGSRIEFGYCAAEKDVYRYQGAEYDVIRFDELTHFSEQMYIYLISRLRGTKDYPRQVKSSTNPGGVGHTWVKARFVDIGGSDRVHSFDDGEGGVTTRIFLPSKVQDNPFLMQADPGYVKRLKLLPEAEQRALLLGDWDIFEGQYFEMFRREIHTFQPFDIPEDWRRYVSLDYGRDMFAALFIALDERGRAWVYNEIYQSGLLVSEAAELLASYIEAEGRRPDAVFAPPDLWNKHSDTGKSTAQIFADRGIYFSRASNDRVQGWYELAEWLRVYRDEQGQNTARLKIGTNCINLLRTLPSLQRDDKNPNDCAKEPHELTHAPDALRYFVAGQPWSAAGEHSERYEREVDDFLSYGK